MKIASDLKASPKKVALINVGGLGDQILFSPVLDELKRALPQCHLTLFLEARSQAVVSLLPQVDAVECLQLQGKSKAAVFWQLLQKLRQNRYDAVLSCGSSPFIALLLAVSGIPLKVGFNTGGLSQKLLTVAAPLNKQQHASSMYVSLAQGFLAYLQGDLYTPLPQSLPRLTIPEVNLQVWAQRFYQASRDQGQKVILLHPGVSQVSLQKGIDKTWSPERWAGLIETLTPHHRLFLVGGPEDEAIVQSILAHLPQSVVGFTNLYGQTQNLAQLAAVIQQADVLVSVDSSPLHIAVGLNKPVVAMFGPTDEQKLLPSAPHWVAVTTPTLPCRPCLWDVRQQNCETSECLQVSVTAMAEAVEQLLNTPVEVLQVKGPNE